MAKLGQVEIRKKAVEIVKATPGGIRYGALVKKLQAISPETPVNTIHGSIWDLHAKCPNEVTKPSRGLFAAADGSQPPSQTSEEAVIETPAEKVREAAFYEPFAEYLKNELNEAVAAIPFGGASLGKKWGTPDVIGVYKPSTQNMIKFGIEIVSAEIKINPLQPIVAFGQAIAYRLFSAKTYIAMPTTISEEDLSRLDALCMLFGVGLVLFTPNPEGPDFSIRVRAQRFFPDMFYVNEFADRLKDSDVRNFEKLFG